MSVCKGLGFLGDAPQISTRGSGRGCVHVPACPRVGTGTLWDVPGRFPENQPPGSHRHWQQLDLAFPRPPPGVANLCPRPRLCSTVRMPCSEARGEATAHAPGPAGHIGQGARAGGWDLWLFFRALPAALSLRCPALCAPHRLGVGGML